jgi:hypothetical protein
VIVGGVLLVLALAVVMTPALAKKLVASAMPAGQARVLKGDLSAKSSLNPLTDLGALNARTRLVLSHRGGAWRSGQGTLTRSELFVGQTSVKLDRRLPTNCFVKDRGGNPHEKAH